MVPKDQYKKTVDTNSVSILDRRRGESVETGSHQHRWHGVCFVVNEAICQTVQEQVRVVEKGVRVGVRCVPWHTCSVSLCPPSLLLNFPCVNWYLKHPISLTLFSTLSLFFVCSLIVGFINFKEKKRFIFIYLKLNFFYY